MGGNRLSTRHWAGVEHDNDDLDQCQAGLDCLVTLPQLFNAREPSAVPHVRLRFILLRGDFPLVERGGRDAIIWRVERLVAIDARAVLRLYDFRYVPDDRVAWESKAMVSEKCPKSIAG